MTDAEPPHRSRFGWPTQTEPTTTPAGTHSHKQSNGPLLLAFFCIILLFLVSVGLVWFILARGEARDAANDRMQKQIRDSWCKALDAFPRDNFFLDQLRRDYECGPGLPVESLPPDVQRDLNGAPDVPAPDVPEGVETLPEDFALPGGAVPQPEPAVPYFPTPGVPEPAPTIPPPAGFPPPDPVQPPPLVDLTPVTDEVCAALGVCV